MIPPWRAKRGSDGQGKPPNRGPGSNRPIRRAGLGLLYLAIGRREGFEDFGNTSDAYLASLAPLVAFDLVSNAVLAVSGSVHAAALIFLSTLCVMLAPAVVSHPICRRWGATEHWARYANILNWAQMLVFLLLAVAGAVAKLAVEAGAPLPAVENGLRLVTLCYVLWFQWFIARGALSLSRWRTVLLLLACGFANLLLLAALLLTSTHVKLG
jgi:hypothetical protein